MLRSDKSPFLLGTLLLAACGAEGSTAAVLPGGSTGVTQGGARDIGRFRTIVEEGGVPTPESLDDVGFFAEHALDLPPADCGTDVCVHPMLAVAPSFSGGNWTTAFVAMNSAVDAARRERPPVHVVVAVERNLELSDYAAGLAPGLQALAGELREGDRLSLISFGRSATVVLEGALPSELGDSFAPQLLSYGQEGVDLYAAIARAGELATSLADFEGERRLVLLTSGRADLGIHNPERILALAQALAARQLPISVIGVSDPNNTLPGQIGEIGAGTFAYASGSSDLIDILDAEGRTSLLPLATDMKLELRASAGYRIGRIYGVPRAQADLERAYLSTPALYLGQRSGAHDVEHGRRGGGGGLFVELIAEPARGGEIGPAAPAFEVHASWQNAKSGQSESMARVLINPLAPGQNPPVTWPHFSDPTRGKPFMMLNMYLALRAAVDFYDAGDCSRALGLVDMMGPMISEWQRREHDPDIAADAELMLRLRNNVSQACVGKPPVEPRSLHAGCFGI